MSKSCPELLREAANLIEEALSRTPPAPAAQSQQMPAAPSRTPVQAEVARLFAPYNGGTRRNMTRRPAQVQVIGRTMRQIKQLRKGLKDMMVWPLLTSRPDVVPLILPKMAEMQFTPQMLLEKITWPVEDSDDEDFDIESTCHITGFLRMFIETDSSGTVAQLLTFWVGWERLPPELKVEISGGTLSTSSTCFETLKLPAHFKAYIDFEKALVSAINSAQTGFGLV